MASSNTNIIQITLPASKSISNRWLVMDYLSANGIKIKNLSSADDTQLLKRLLRQLKMNRRHNYDCHDAGTAARFLTALLAFTPGTHTIVGTPRLCQRPMAPLIEALRSIGCHITCTGKEGFLPLKIEGTIPTADRIIVDGTLSSQFVSALLQASILLPQGLKVEVTGISTSEPYIEMTLNVMEMANINWDLKGTPPAFQLDHSLPRADIVTIEKDWSAASYFYTTTAIKPSLHLRMVGLYKESLQGDSVVKDIYSHFGVVSQQTDITNDVTNNGEYDKVFAWDFTNTPDLFPAVAVTCAELGIDAHLKGIDNLRIKESDRVKMVAEELKKMNCKVEITDHEVHILPSQLTITQPVDPHGDHRIAMAFAALKVKYPEVEVLTPDVVSKSFPTFWEMLDRAVVDSQ